MSRNRAVRLFALLVRSALCLSVAMLTVFGSASAAEPGTEVIDNLSEAFERVATKIKPSVVSISAVKKARPQQSMSGQQNPFENSPYEEFFEHFFRNQQPDNRGYSQQGVGSGVIVNAEGFILTNNHVVEDADELTVTLHNGDKLEAELVGADSKTDLAVIKVKGKDLVPAPLGDSDQLRVGKWVVAVGNPFNLSQSITAGIVSAVGRSNMGIADYEDFIQTDAAINPGNSGGPLVNLSGEVIGINTAIFSRSGGYMGIGFAIPSKMAKSIMDRLISDGKIVRGFLGVMIQPLDENLSNSFRYKSTDGALVSEVKDGTPAADAKLLQGDIITEYDGTKIKDPNQLRNMVAETTPGQRAKLQVYRSGRYTSVSVKIGELDAETVEAPDKPSAAEDLGISVQELTPELARRFRLDLSGGVIVTRVLPGGVAQDNGIRVGDVIIDVQGKQIDSVDDFTQAMDDIDLEDGVRLTVKRGDNQFFLYIKTG